MDNNILHFKNVTDDVENKCIDLKLSSNSSSDLDMILTEQQFRVSDSEIREEAISHGEMYIENIKPGSVILQLRPVTEQAALKLLNAKENNRLLEMILAMLKHTDMKNMLDTSKSLEINVQVCYATSTKSKEGEL